MLSTKLIRTVLNKFYGKFSFRVIMDAPLPKREFKPKILDQTKPWLYDTDIIQNRVDTRREHTNKLSASCPDDYNVWRMLDRGNDVNFYFMEEMDAKKFAIQNNRHLKYFDIVTSPQIDISNDDIADAIDVKNILYWGCYRWKIIFKRNTRAEAEADEWFEHLRLGYSPEECEQKFLYSHVNQRSLYLRDYHDVLSTKLFMVNNISKICKALLKSELHDGYEPCANTI